MAAKKTAKVQANEQTTKLVQFSKAQILASAKFTNRRDLVDALLAENSNYTMEQVDKLVSDYMKGQVK